MFSLGQIVSTPGAFNYLQPYEIECIFNRHVNGDWGDLCEEDKQANNDALKHGDRILSAYIIRGQKIWIITEADRSSTCVLLPSEY